MTTNGASEPRTTGQRNLGATIRALRELEGREVNLALADGPASTA